MSIKKQFLKSRPVCKVTFRLSREAVNDAKTAHITGEFNNWEKPGAQMKAYKNGSFAITLDLDQGRDYQFRYLLDQKTWINDDEADHQVPSGFAGSHNSVVSV